MNQSESQDSEEYTINDRIELDELEDLYISIVQQLAQRYAVANQQLAMKYMKTAWKIASVWENDCNRDGTSGNPLVTEKANLLLQCKGFVSDVEKERLSNGSRLFFEQNVSQELQIERQREFYSEFPDPLYFKVGVPQSLSVKIRLKPDEKRNSKNTSIGTQPLSLSHIDESKLHLLNGFYLVYGNIQCIYKFESSKEIKVNVISKKEALRVINQLLKVIRPEMLKGTAAKNCWYPKRSEKRKPHELSGIKAHAIGYDLYRSDGTRTSIHFRNQREG